MWASIVQKKYGVQLSAHDKGRLGRSSAQAITRARILLKTDEGWTASQVAQPWPESTEREGLGSGISGEGHERRPSRFISR